VKHLSSSGNQFSGNLRHVSFEQVYHDHVDALFHYGSKFKIRRSLLEDCIQDLFADLWEKRDELHKINSLRFYLLGALRRKVFRKIYTDRELLMQAEELPLQFEMDFLQQEDASQLLTDEQIQHIRQAFDQLTDKQKEVLYLRFYNQLSFQEIADLMAIQTRAVYKLSSRSLASLREHFFRNTELLSWLIYFAFIQ
jgi:RNA polymerase sigma factor (sigma-70 family)